ncbi:MAG: tRNA glutamyl-Q(34) synthetase GluQRS [Kangiellaceae bacterium]
MQKSQQKSFQETIEPSIKKDWVGRFAPSPTGPLHMGSLAAAVASYMVAKQNKGKWLVRIEDIDEQRVVKGSADSILHDLEDYGLFWDGDVFYQSQNKNWHEFVLEKLAETELLYPCSCSRKDILQRSGGVYDGRCRSKKNQLRHVDLPNLKTSDHALRIDFRRYDYEFEDVILKQQQFLLPVHQQDFVIKRRDGVLAYQLVVVADDIYQEVNHVVRGVDILDSTLKQMFIYHCLNKNIPCYYHIPLITDENNLKLSKSLNSASLKEVEYLQDQKNVLAKSEILIKVFEHLGQTIDPFLHAASTTEIIEHFVKNWDTRLVRVHQDITK